MKKYSFQFQGLLSRQKIFLLRGPGSQCRRSLERSLDLLLQNYPLHLKEVLDVSAGIHWPLLIG